VPGAKRTCRAVLDGAARGQDEHVVCEAADLTQIVRDKQHLGAPSHGSGDDALDQLGRGRVEAGRWLIEEKELRLAHEGADQREALPLASRELGRWVASPVEEPHTGEGCLGTISRRRDDRSGSSTGSCHSPAVPSAVGPQRRPSYEEGRRLSCPPSARQDLSPDRSSEFW
jgi:hypothetical protein